MSVEEVLESKWICPKCGVRKPRVRKVALTGAGLSRLVNWQHLEYYMVSCPRCGYTEAYDAEILGDRDKAMSVMDLLLGH
ncbi:MAG: zinc ribbon domain-containing protein [Desulfurococcales archaeon]|nr:zinc ribbon domain-containing protein [Desulfurococcales archaeon]